MQLKHVLPPRSRHRLSALALCRETPPDAAAKAAADAAAKVAADAAAAAAAKKGATLSLTQAELDEMIEGRLAKERRIIESRLGIDPVKQKEAAEELERLRQADKDRKQKELEEKGNYDRALQSLKDEFGAKESTWTTKERELLEEIRDDRCRGRLVAELTTQGSWDPEDDAEVLLKRVTLDDTRQVVVLGEDKKPAFASGRPVTIKDLVTKFKTDKPRRFKAENDGEGAGAQGGAAGADAAANLEGIDAEIKAAEAELEAARKTARATQAMGDVTASRQAARKLQDLKDKKKKGKAA